MKDASLLRLVVVLIITFVFHINFPNRKNNRRRIQKKKKNKKCSLRIRSQRRRRINM